MRRIKTILREPLLHFVLLGGILYVLSTYRESPITGLQEEIVVSSSAIESLQKHWERTWQRPASRAELNSLIEDYIREEVFYREALRMGLAEDDTIVRRRLRQKMEFLAEEFVQSAALDDTALAAYFDANAENYRRDDRYTLKQVYFNLDDQTEGIMNTVAHTIDDLKHGRAAFDAAGNRSMLPRSLTNASEREIRAHFGQAFLDALTDIEVGVWTGPVESGLGLHAVFVEERVPGVIPTLDEVRAAVERDWNAQRNADAKDTLFEELKENYRIRIEYPKAELDVPAQ